MPVRLVTRCISLLALTSGLLLGAPAIAVAHGTAAAYEIVVVTNDSGARTNDGGWSVQRSTPPDRQ